MPVTLSPQQEALSRQVGEFLLSHFPDSREHQEDEWTVRNDSARVFVTVGPGLGSAGCILSVQCPLVHRVPVSDELFRWVATYGQDHVIGSVYLVMSGERNTCELWFGHTCILDVLVSSHILGSVYPVLTISNDLDNQLQARFGGIITGTVR
jgi:hypothetical protein